MRRCNRQCAFQTERGLLVLQSTRTHTQRPAIQQWRMRRRCSRQCAFQTERGMLVLQSTRTHAKLYNNGECGRQCSQEKQSKPPIQICNCARLCSKTHTNTRAAW